MTRYAVRALRAQWWAWIGTFAVLAASCAVVYVCLVHRFTVTRPEVVAAARRAGVGPQDLELSGLVVYFYCALVTIPVVALVGRSCVEALRPSWAQWRLAGALPRQVFWVVLVTVGLVGAVSCVPGVALGAVAAQPASSVLTLMASRRMGPLHVQHNAVVVAISAVTVVGLAVVGAIAPALGAVRVPATEVIRDTARSRTPMGAGRWVLAALWCGVCVVQALVAFGVRPQRTPPGELPAGSGQAMLVALLLALLTVIVAPVVITPVLLASTAPLKPLGAVWRIARRSAAWRGGLASSAVALLALGFSFTGALTTSLATNEAVVRAAGIRRTVNQVDTMVMATILGGMATLGAVAVVAMSSRSREREFASLRCAGATPAAIRRQALAEAASYVGTALVLSVVPTLLTAVGEARYFALSGLPFVPKPAWQYVLGVAVTAFVGLAIAIMIPTHRALYSPVGRTLSPE